MRPTTANKNGTPSEPNDPSARPVNAMRPKGNHRAGRMFTKRPINLPAGRLAIRL